MSETLGDRLQAQVYYFHKLTEGSLENHCRNSQDKSILLLSVNLTKSSSVYSLPPIFFQEKLQQTMDFNMSSTQMPLSPPNQKKLSW